MSEKKYRIEMEEDGWPQFMVTIGDSLSARDYGFTFMSIPEDKWEWLAQVVEDNLKMAYEMGVRRGRSMVAEPLVEALEQAGIKVERR